jgi:YfiH family protein
MIIKPKIFGKYPQLLLAVSEKKDGSMRLSDLNDKDISENRNRFFGKLGIAEMKTISAVLVLGNKVKIIGKNETNTVVKKIDGLITNQKGIFLSITVADCLPIFIFDPEKEILALLHCGRQGLSKGIIKNGIKFLRKLKGKPQKTLAFIGPGICQKHYQVGREIAAEFFSFNGAVKKTKKRFFLNLKEIAKQQLISCGLTERNIEMSRQCSFCLKNKYFSYRRDKKNPLEAMAVIFGLKTG